MLCSRFVGVVVAVLCVSMSGVSVFAESPAAAADAVTSVTVGGIGAGPLARSARAEAARLAADNSSAAEPADAAQSPSRKPSPTLDDQWDAVRRLTPGTDISLNLRGGAHQRWRLVGTTDAGLTVAFPGSPSKKVVEVERGQVALLAVESRNPGRGAAGAVAGTVGGFFGGLFAGGAIGHVLGGCDKGCWVDGGGILGALIGGVTGGVAVGILAYHAAARHDTTIYTAP